MKSKDPYVNLARETIQAYVCGKKLPGADSALPEEMKQNRAGAFVSVHRNGQLRGCIGTIAPVTDCIAEEIVANAVSAVSKDPRFSPVVEEELGSLEISVDVLTPLEPVKKIEELDPKRYGVVVSSGYRRGVLLPDLEGIDDVETQLFIALQKAGINPKETYSIERFEVVRHV